ncbi:NAD-dependent epimerase/dehydratase family protein [Corallincola luteus]|uniref:NAD-dependent epimerase/dehydratase family protein n=2 Tax=Corallincola luteus TaxID=1775177 RepID=A0ABY2AS36_9GAMM|nr:NAD-dependent epimerase/dehydratase family protein [Corallincola luteus]
MTVLMFKAARGIEMTESKIAFVTGATGFLGGHLVRQLTDAGWTVYALKRASSDTSALADLAVFWIEADLLDIDSIEEALPAHCDALFHVASDTSVWRRHDDRQTRINIDGTRALLKMAERQRIGRFIYTSSISAYGFHQGVINEQSQKLGKNSGVNYLHTKCCADQMVIEAAGRLDTVVLNPCHIMGPGDRHNWMQLFRLIKTNRLPGIPPGGGPFCHVAEVARAHISAYEQGRRGENYILGGQYHQMKEVCEQIAKLQPVPLSAKVIPASFLLLIGYCKQALAALTNREPDITPEKAAMVSKKVMADSHKAREQFGYNDQVPLTQILSETNDWLVAKKLI